MINKRSIQHSSYVVTRVRGRRYYVLPVSYFHTFSSMVESQLTVLIGRFETSNTCCENEEDMPERLFNVENAYGL